MKKMLLAFLLVWTSVVVQAAEYRIDDKGAHAIIQFKIKHLGYSWLLGRFNTFEGTFSYDENNPQASKVKVVVDTASVDSNHAERDKHLRSDDFLAVKDYPQATFVSKKVDALGEGKAKITGDLTVRGVTKEIVIDANYVGGGKDPWGGYRQGFEGTTTLVLKDFGIPKSLGPASEQVQMYLSVEGVKQ
jgi:polyisoprenoid-binding protein YceI